MIIHARCAPGQSWCTLILNTREQMKSQPFFMK
jgi:hypothetical protein